MRITSINNLIFTRETNTIRTTAGARIKRFESTAGAAGPEARHFEPVGASFEAAVRLANTRAQATRPGQAQAVVQGRDGAFYLTPLVDSRGRALAFDGVTNDPHPADRRGRREAQERVVHTDWVLRLDPSVLAVVGGRSWANFTEHRVEFGLELIQSATHRAVAS